MSETDEVAQVVSEWKGHPAGCGVAPRDIELYAGQLHRPFLRKQREEAQGSRC